MLEQMIPFVSGLLAMGAVVSDQRAANCGLCYVFFRALYPICFNISPNLILLSTIPNYLLVFYMWAAIVLALM
jgi:hypothetical protein